MAIGPYRWRRRPASRFGPLLVAFGLLVSIASWQGTNAALGFDLGVLAEAPFFALTFYLFLTLSNVPDGRRLQHPREPDESCTPRPTCAGCITTDVRRNKVDAPTWRSARSRACTMSDALWHDLRTCSTFSQSCQELTWGTEAIRRAAVLTSSR